jgi:CubicO group peptidase (beta-lactamase class C family)
MTIGFVAPAGAQEAGYARTHELDSKIEKIMESWNCPGLAVAVVQDDEVVFARGYGVRELGTDDPVDENTIFGIGSMSKSFGTASVGLIVDDGKAGWDDPIVEHLPWFALEDPWVTRHATLRDFASHKLGYDSNFVWIPRTWSRQEVVRRARHLKPIGIDFRAGYFYANVTMMTLGEVVAAESGQNWESFVKERLFEPLGMTRSFTNDPEYVDERQMAPCWVCEPPEGAKVGSAALREGFTDVAVPHGLDADGEMAIRPWRYDQSGPAGSISSTVMDIARWLRFHINRGEIEGKRIMSEDSMFQIHTPQNIVPAQRPDPDNPPNSFAAGFDFNSYGFGWWVSSYRGHVFNVHGGGQVGYGTLMAFVPEAKLGVVVLQNMDWRESYAYVVVLRTLIDHYLALPPMDWNPMAHDTRRGELAAVEAALAQLKVLADEGLEPTLPLAAYAGRYNNDALGEVRVSVEDGALVIQFDPLANADLEHLGHDQFAARFRNPTLWMFGARFGIGLAGQVDTLTLGGLGGLYTEYEFTRVD